MNRDKHGDFCILLLKNGSSFGQKGWSLSYRLDLRSVLQRVWLAFLAALVACCLATQVCGLGPRQGFMWDVACMHGW